MIFDSVSLQKQLDKIPKTETNAIILDYTKVAGLSLMIHITRGSNWEVDGIYSVKTNEAAGRVIYHW